MRRLLARLVLLAALLVPAAAFAQSAASPFTSGVRYDAERRVVGTIAPDPDGASALHYLAVRNTYDARGRLTQVETGELAAWQDEMVAPMAWTGFTVYRRVDTTYDPDGRKLAETLSADGVAYVRTQWRWDANDRVMCQAVRMKPAGNFATAPADACVPDAGGLEPDRIVHTQYDGAGRVTLVQRGYGTPLQQDYATYRYTANGRRKAVIDANGAVARYAYDALDRLSAWYFPSSTTVGQASTTDFETYSYDANGNRTILRKRDGRQLAFTYDALNRVTKKTVPQGCAPIQVGPCSPVAATRDVHYGYDLRGLQTDARFDSPTGEGIANSYDGLGRLTGTTTTMGGAARALTFDYDADGNRTRITHPDATWFEYGYDGLDRLRDIGQQSPDGLAVNAYDAVGARRKLVTGGVTVFARDGIGRLTSQSDDLAGASADLATVFAYNPASQIVSRSRDNDAYAGTGFVSGTSSYVVNGLNQYTASAGAGLVHDANGNLSSDGSVTYTYDLENRLVAASNGTALRYDPLGRLWRITSGSADTRFVYDGDRLTLEYDASGSVLRRYVHGAGADDPVAWYEGATVGSGNGRLLSADHQGSIVAAMDFGGTALSLNAYDDYGNPGTSNAGRFQYTGQVWLPELGLYYYKARMYRPDALAGARFLQVDPVGYDDEINLYTYVANDPVNGRDPDGKQAVQAAQAAGRACASNATCSSTVARGVATLAAAIGIELSQRNDNRDRINVDTNVLINVLDNPTSPSAASANSILAGKVANVSITAANEYVTGSEKGGVTPDMAKERLGAMITSGRAELGPSGGIAGTAVGMMKGLSMGDASIIAAGKEKGIPTLTQDRKMLKIEPESTIRY